MPVPTYTREQLLTLISTKLANNSIITAPEHREVEEAIVNAIYGQVGDIKEIACDINYINANFKTGTSLLDEGLGLPTGERYGWAICNGKNGTINKMGRVAIGYDPVNYPITTAGSNTGGSKNAVLIGHEHDSIVYTNGQKGVNQLGTGPSIFGWAVAGQNATEKTNKTSKNGISDTGVVSNNETGVNKNMQPYIVTLFIQRIPMS